MPGPAKPQSDRVTKLLTQATQALEKGDTARALLFARKALAIRPRDPQGHKLLGQIHQRMGKGSLAPQSLAAAQELSPGTDVPQPTPEPPPAADESAARTSDFGEERATSDPLPPRPALRSAQRQDLVESAMKCLARIAETEHLMEEKGLAGEEVFRVIQQNRLKLAEQLQQARAARRVERAASALPSPVSTPQSPPASAEYRALPPFTHTLGPIAGAVASGDEVSNLQKLLNLESLHVAVTGNYDTSTVLAVRKLQEKYGLRNRDGIVGGETRRLLNRLIGQGR